MKPDAGVARRPVFDRVGQRAQAGAEPPPAFVDVTQDVLVTMPADDLGSGIAGELFAGVVPRNGSCGRGQRCRRRRSAETVQDLGEEPRLAERRAEPLQLFDARGCDGHAIRIGTGGWGASVLEPHYRHGRLPSGQVASTSRPFCSPERSADGHERPLRRFLAGAAASHNGNDHRGRDRDRSRPGGEA